MKYLTLVLSLLTLTSNATTYYIDFASGLDSNTGRDTAHPWQRQPYMPGFTGSYTHATGDRFIFKGGVTWTYSGVWIIKLGGTAASPDYYGVDKTWFTGGAWTRPIIDGQSSKPYFILIGNNSPYSPTAQNVTFDNFEMKNLFWSGHPGFGNCCFFNSVDGTTNTVIQNCYLHDWTHGTFGGGTSDDLICITGTSASPYNAGCVVNNCVIDGGAANSSNGNCSGAGLKQWGGKILNCTIKNCVSAILLGGGTSTNSETAYNDIGPVYVSFDSNQHDNAIHSVLGGVHYIHDNYVHDSQSVCMMLGESGGVGAGNEINYVWNNVIWNPLASYAFYFDTTANGAKHFVWNNTVASSPKGPFRVIFRASGGVTDTLSLINNHVVYGGSLLDVDPSASVTHSTNQNNVNISATQATTEGFNVANRWVPPSLSCSTINAGQTLPNTMPSAQIGGLSADILAVGRPQATSRWDAGAYEFVSGGGGGSSPPATPSNVSPTAGAVNVSITPTLQASAYSDPQSSAQAGSQWKVFASDGTTVVHDSGAQGAVTSYAVPSSALQYSTLYKFAARYLNALGLWSSYSALTSFTTTNSPPVTLVITNATVIIQGAGFRVQ